MTCYRYIEYGDGSMELYDHANAPNEWDNLAADVEFGDVIRTLKQKVLEGQIK